MPLTAGFETGISGNTITTADTGDADAFDLVTIAAGGSAKYDNAQAALGSLSAKLVQAATPGALNLAWSTAFGVSTDHYGRLYIYRTANPGATVALVVPFNGGSFASRIYLFTNGKISISDSTGAALATSAAALPLNAWSRIEWHIVHNTSTGSVECRIFSDPFSPIPTETLSVTGRNTLASANKIQVGFDPGGGQGAAGDTIWIDGLVAAALDWPGSGIPLNQSGTLIPGPPPPVEITFTLDRRGNSPLRITPVANSLKFTTLAQGGFGSCTFDVEGPLAYWRREIPELSLLTITYGEQVIYQGQVEDHGKRLADGQLLTTITCFGLQRRLDEVSIVRMWSKRDMQWEDETVSHRDPNKVAYGAWTLTTGRFDPTNLARDGVAFTGTNLRNFNSPRVRFCLWWCPPGITPTRILNTYGEENGTGFNGLSGYIDGTGTFVEITNYAPGAQDNAVPAGAIAVCLGVKATTSPFTPDETIQGYHYGIRILGTASLEDDSSDPLTAGFYGGTILRDLIPLIPDLAVGTVDDGSEFAIPQVSQDHRDFARVIVNQVVSLYEKEWGVWEDGRLDWHAVNLDEAQWLTTLENFVDLDLQSSVDGIARTAYVLYDNAAATPKGRNIGEASSSSVEQRNPYVKQGRTKDFIVSAGVPMTPSSSAQLAAKVSADRGGSPFLTGRVTVPARCYLNHATGGARPAILLRAGDNITIADLPKSDVFFQGRDGETLFHVVSTGYDAETDRLDLELEAYSNRMDVLLARVAAATKVLTG